MDIRKTLESRLNQLDVLIGEAEQRLGAHSVKPVLMQQLFDLEEEREAIVAQLAGLSSETTDSNA